MRRNTRQYPDDILEAITQIQEYIFVRRLGRVHAGQETQDAVVRNLEIIGKAAARLPESITS